MYFYCGAGTIGIKYLLKDIKEFTPLLHEVDTRDPVQGK